MAESIEKPGQTVFEESSATRPDSGGANKTENSPRLPVRTRLALAGDVERVRRLLEQHRGERGVPASAPLVLELGLDDERRGQSIIVAESEQELLGMVVAQRIQNVMQGSSFLLLSDIYVLPGRRRLGVASALMREVTVLARSLGCCEMRLLVSNIDHPALITAARSGFTQHNDLLLTRTL